MSWPSLRSKSLIILALPLRMVGGTGAGKVGAKDEASAKEEEGPGMTMT